MDTSDEFATPLRVMAVDDDESALEVLGAYCGDFGFRFYGLDDPEEAVDFAASVIPDVILTDAMMAGISGFELCRRMRERRELALVPIVMVTSLDARNDRIRALEVGATDFLTKPVDRLLLGARVRSLGRIRRLTESLDSADRVLDSLALCAEARDHTTGEHCERLRRSGRAFGEFLGLDAQEVQALERAGYLHDIGKIAIPDAVLQKPGKLTPEEWEVMKTHAAAGADLLAPLATMARVLPIVRHHHERWDGKGYPAGMAGEEIPRLARVFQLLDSWDALTHARPYKKAFSAAESMDILERESAEGRWDPHLFSEFKRWSATTAEGPAPD
ncbi:MAG: response regulator [Candidatus Sumerlaeia bacterium]|nr:response regulator [Candidatus Sumerlaeia bacterium]